MFFFYYKQNKKVIFPRDFFERDMNYYNGDLLSVKK